MHIIRNIVIILLLLIAQAQQGATAQIIGTNDKNSTANAIAKKSFNLESPETISMSVQMSLISPSGATRKRDVEVIGKNRDENVRFIHFISPQDVAGTKFLNFKKKGKNNTSITETRMFTPSDKKIRSITSSSRKNAFMGSDLSYYDLEEHEYGDFSYSLLAKGQKIADKSFAGREFYTLRAQPYNKNAPYSSMIYWIDKQSYQIRRIECLEDEIKVKDIYILQNLSNTKYYIPKILLAVNHKKNGHRTVWQVQKVQINPALAPHVFSIQNLN